MSATPPQIAMGYNSRIDIDGTALGVRTWSIEHTADPHEVGDTEDGQYKKTQTARKEARASLQCFEDTANSYYIAPLSLEAGTVLENVRVYPRGLESDPWFFPYVVVTQGSHRGDVNNPNDMNFSFVSIGPYYPPGTSA